MVSYDTTQIALFVSLVLTVAVIGTILVLGVLTEALIRNRRTGLTHRESRRGYHGRLAFHH
jgi:Tfp pilus assembly protein PilX